jgi:rhodanese-related sulfurtransferase
MCEVTQESFAAVQTGSAVDVREPVESVAGLVPGAAMTAVPARAGFDAHSVIGGTSAWSRSGRPLVIGPAPTS